MKQLTMKKLSYKSPKLEIIRFTTAPVLNSVSATGAYSIGYGGVDENGKYGD